MFAVLGLRISKDRSFNMYGSVKNLILINEPNRQLVLFTTTKIIEKFFNFCVIM
jgi:hypothetical protein